MDVSFIDSSRRKKEFKYLTFLPKKLRPIALGMLALNALSIIVVLIFFSSLQKEIPLFYSLPDLQQLSKKETILILPGLASVITATHFLIVKHFKNAHPTILHVFLLSSLALQVLILAIILRLLIILH